MASSSANKNFLVTGAGRGIGRGLSRLLLRKGHRVLLVDNNAEELDHISAKLSRDGHARGSDFDIAHCDLRSPSDIRVAADAANELFDGHIDCLVNNAAYTGGVGGTPLADLTLEEWQTSIETNLTGPMLMSQACLPMLRKQDSSRVQGGSIIHMSSTRAFMSEPNNEGYSTTKAGLLGLTQAMAVSLAPQGVRVNTILPGWIHGADECKGADESGRAWEEGLSEGDHGWHLTGRVGRVEDVLKAVEYLVDAGFVTGAEVVVDGGVTRKMVYPD
ncbi:hypothetical protein LTR36_000847 [Oleoguttula mirabilis]|uniref:Uncharacterized protein n=1 Tax=Oleoguttula mirabilis TaxID=1507867 RepID=A0AAV9J3B7_9PEZI|nr:hypothetical protein LTR36_000847 [Oleoguttula mirabilis]